MSSVSKRIHQQSLKAISAFEVHHALLLLLTHLHLNSLELVSSISYFIDEWTGCFLLIPIQSLFLLSSYCEIETKAIELEWQMDKNLYEIRRNCGAIKKSINVIEFP